MGFGLHVVLGVGYFFENLRLFCVRLGFGVNSILRILVRLKFVISVRGLLHNLI